MKQSKLKLFQSVVALLLCVSMFVGTTFAWFTDSVTSDSNIIKSGKLDVEMYWADGTQDPAAVTWTDASTGAIFNNSLWEPGYTEVRHIKIANEGNLALQYQLQIVANGEVSNLADVIDVYYLDPAQQITQRSALTENMKLGNLTAALSGMATSANGTLSADKEVIVTIALKMQETAGNEYQNLAIGSSFAIVLMATQFTEESDSFGNNYDKGATFDFPDFTFNDSVSAAVVSDDENKVAAEVTLQGSQSSAVIPAGVQLEAGANAVTLNVNSMNSSSANITLGENEAIRPLNVHVDGVAADNTQPMAITLEKAAAVGLNSGNLKLYHVENGETKSMTRVADEAEFTAHNQFKYDSATGDVTLYMATFSEVALVADTVNAWNGTVASAFAGGTGTETEPYIIANADQLAYLNEVVSNDNENYGNKHYELISHINFGGEENTNEGIIFYPIGYHKVGGAVAALSVDEAPEAFYIIEEDTKTSGGAVSESSTEWYTYGGAFSGTFDGAGHTIFNIYQNTWQLKGNYDGNYWNAAMGLFGYVYNGTVKNLTVNNFQSDGEFTPTGVIAAYAANSTFENIAITDCNPRVYNTGNGGIVGIGGNTSDTADKKLTFTNITIDNTNKISALWGSWDVACGGLVGMFRGAGHVYMTNCHVAAQIDVYNDVCGNYQYYWYRYAGMMIGTNKNMTTDANGYTVPETSKFHATGCTVHFGEWNDYYYCELVANSLASYTHDHQFSRLAEVEAVNGTTITYLDGTTGTVPDSGRYNYVVVDGEAATENAACYHFVDGNVWNHEDAGTETVDGQTVLKEDKQHVYLPFNQLFTGYGWGVKHIPVYNGEDYAFAGITILDREVADSVVKFETKFTGDFLYRVGNQNTVSLGSLFAAEDGVTINNSGVYVTIDKVDESSNVSGTFTANTTDWTKGTIQFTGTGVVKVTIQDYNYCQPTVLYLEVVDAKNATTATSATANNVVLLNDCGLSTIEVSGGYTLYGNGFKMTAASDVRYHSMGVGFVTLNNGTLDNVQIVCPNFSYSVVYNSNITETGNQHSYDSNSESYGNVRSAVMADGNSKIINSYIHGGRAAIFLRSGNLVVDGSTISGGATANIHAISAQSLTLRNVTLIQKPFEATVHDTSKTIMGFSGLFECDENGASTPLILEGTLVQNAWINETYKDYAPSAASSIIDKALEETAYLHDLNADGIRESLNLGFTYIPQTTGGSTNANVTDNRSNKGEVPYEAVDVGTTLASAKVYSYKNTEGTSEDYYIEEEYTPNTQGTTVPTISFTDTSEDRVFETKFDTSDNRWESSLTVNLDNGDYTFSFNNLLAQKHGTNLAYTVKTEDGADVDISDTISLTASAVTNYVLTITDSDATHTVYFILIATQTSIPEPEVVDTTGGTPLLVVKSKGSDWSCAIPALEGIKIKYYTSANDSVTLDLATLTPTSTGKQNGTNNYWEYSNGYKLKVTCGYIHDTKQVYGMPVVVNNDGNKMYFTISSTNGYVSTSTTSRTVTLTYEFTDPNGKTLTFTKTWQFNYADYKSGTQYSYSDFVNGTLKEASSGCVTPDTLVTLADGSQKEIQYVSYEDELLVWNFYTGECDVASASIIMNHGADEYTIVSLNFNDGTTIKTINGHGFYHEDSDKFVILNQANVADYVGHSFTKQDGTTAKLVSYDVHEKYTESWSVLTAGHYNCILEGMLTITPAEVDGSPNYLMPFEVGDGMKFDETKMKADIEKYGLYTYEDFAEFMTEEQFTALGLANWKVAVEKGYITWEDIFYLIGIHIG